MYDDLIFIQCFFDAFVHFLHKWWCTMLCGHPCAPFLNIKRLTYESFWIIKTWSYKKSQSKFSYTKWNNRRLLNWRTSIASLLCQTCKNQEDWAVSLGSTAQHTGEITLSHQLLLCRPCHKIPHQGKNGYRFVDCLVYMKMDYDD